MRQSRLKFGIEPKKYDRVAVATTSESGPTEDARPPDGERWFEPILSVPIFTARYSNKNVADSGLTAIRITRYPPRFKLPYKPVVVMDLAPTANILQIAKTGTQKKFTTLFAGQLAELDPKDIGERLVKIHAEGAGKGLVLLCYEDLRQRGNYCHRRQVAAWLEATFGVKVEELPE